MILLDKFIVDLEKEIDAKKELIVSIDKNLLSLEEFYGSISVTKRNDNKYYYLKRKEKDKLYTKYIGKDLSDNELSVYIDKNKAIRILRKRKQLEENKLKILIEAEQKYKKVLTI